MSVRSGRHAAEGRRRGATIGALVVCAALASAAGLTACGGGGGGGGGGGVNASTIALFTAALGNAPTNATQPGLGLGNASELTQVLSSLSSLPLVEVQIDTQTPEQWWICIWEVDDKVRGEQYTVGAAISRDASDPDYLVWISPKIGPQTTELDTQNDATKGLAALVLNEASLFYGISPDSAGDTYHVASSSLTGQTVYTSPCLSDQSTNAQYHYTAEKVNIDFALLSNFTDLGSPATTHQGSIPAGALAQTTGPVPSLRITYEAGCP